MKCKKKQTTPKDDLVSLYRSAFKEFGSRALWNVRELEAPTPKDYRASEDSGDNPLTQGAALGYDVTPFQGLGE